MSKNPGVSQPKQEPHKRGAAERFIKKVEPGRSTFKPDKPGRLPLPKKRGK